MFIGLTVSIFSESKLKIVVSFNAMREFASAVGKDLVEIKTIIPDGVEPHEYEPKASDLIGLNEAKIFIYSGLGMEPWADKTLKAANNKNLSRCRCIKGNNGNKKYKSKYNQRTRTV